jgi:hypothetical protein
MRSSPLVNTRSDATDELRDDSDDFRQPAMGEVSYHFVQLLFFIARECR